MCKFCRYIPVVAVSSLIVFLLVAMFTMRPASSEPAPAYEICQVTFEDMTKSAEAHGIRQANMREQELVILKKVIENLGGSGLYDETVKVTFWQLEGNPTTLITETDAKGCVIFAQEVPRSFVNMLIDEIIKELNRGAMK